MKEKSVSPFGSVGKSILFVNGWTFIVKSWNFKDIKHKCRRDVAFIYFTIVELISVCNLEDFSVPFHNDFQKSLPKLMKPKTKEARALDVVQRFAFVWLSLEVHENLNRCKYQTIIINLALCRESPYMEAKQRSAWCALSCSSTYETPTANLSHGCLWSPLGVHGSRRRSRNRSDRSSA